MKKGILVILIMLVSSAVFSLELYTFGGLSYDYTKVDSSIPYGNEWFESTLAAGVQHREGNILLYTEVEIQTEMYMSGTGTESLLSFMPTHNDYYVRAGVWLYMFFVEYEHLCSHNVDRVDYSRNGGYNRVTVGFDSRGAR